MNKTKTILREDLIGHLNDLSRDYGKLTTMSNISDLEFCKVGSVHSIVRLLDRKVNSASFFVTDHNWWGLTVEEFSQQTIELFDELNDMDRIVNSDALTQFKKMLKA